MKTENKVSLFKYSYDDLFNPLLKVMHELGGSGTVPEINDGVSKYLKLSDAEASDIHRGTTTKLSYRLAWARNYLKRYGLLENSSRAIWALTVKGQSITGVDKEIVKKEVKLLDLTDKANQDGSNGNEEESPAKEVDWVESLLEVIGRMSPDAFERFCKRILRESGFIQVEVTGKSGDGGIDGKGILRLAGFLSFHILFQCKRYKGSVPPKDVRDFRGAMVGRADKGLFITTGTFTREAKKEAVRDGAPPIDLIDGEQLANKVKELGLGVQVEHKENVAIDAKWFEVFQ